MSKQADLIGSHLIALLGSDAVKPEQDLGKILNNSTCKGIRVDYWIPHINLVVEVHGIQHEEARTFGGMSKHHAKQKLVSQLYRDERLRGLCEKHKLNYVEFWYNEDSTFPSIFKKISNYI
jgi:hypothetical protein